MRHDGNWGATGGGLQNPFEITQEQVDLLLEAMMKEQFTQLLDKMEFDESLEYIENKEASNILTAFIKKEFGISGRFNIAAPTLDGLLGMCDNLKKNPSMHSPFGLKMLLHFAVDDLVLVGDDGVPLTEDGHLLAGHRLYDSNMQVIEKHEVASKAAKLVPISNVNESPTCNRSKLRNDKANAREWFEENVIGHPLSVVALIKSLSSSTEGAETSEFNANGKKYEGAMQEDILVAVSAGMNGASREDPLGKFPPSVTHEPECNVILHECKTYKAEVALLEKLSSLKAIFDSKSSEGTNKECQGHDVKNLVNAALLGGCVLNEQAEAIVVDGACHHIPKGGYKFQYAHEARVPLKLIFGGIAKAAWEVQCANIDSVSLILGNTFREFAEMAAKENTIFDFEAMARKSYFHIQGAPREAEFEALAQEMFDVPGLKELITSKEVNFKEFAVSALHLMHSAALEEYFKIHPAQQEAYTGIAKDIGKAEDALAALDFSNAGEKLAAHAKSMGDAPTAEEG